MLLCSSGNYSGNRDNDNRMEIFQNKSMRSVLGIVMHQVKDEEIYNNYSNRWINNVLKAEDSWRNR